MLAKTGFKTACLAGIAALFSSAAVAADFGGACCQDLEERIAELEATTARKGNRKVSLTVYGQVNYAILHADLDTGDPDFDFSETTITNNPNAQTRFGFRGDAKISPDWSAGFLIEIGIGKAEPAIGVSLTDPPSFGGGGKINSDLVVRHSALYLQHAQLGTMWLGQTSTATDGIAEISVANTAVASTLLSLEPLSSAWLGGVNAPFDGGRTDVVRWVSPTFAGFSVSAAWMGNAEDSWDVALRYAGELGDFRLAAGIGYRKEQSALAAFAPVGTDVETITGSASLMHVPSGLFASAGAGKVDGVPTSGTLVSVPIVDLSIPFWFVDPKMVHVQAGIERNFFGWGNTTLFGEWAQFESSILGNHYELDFWGLGVVQSIDNAAMDLYLGYRNYDLDVEDVNATTVVGGAIIRF